MNKKVPQRATLMQQQLDKVFLELHEKVVTGHEILAHNCRQLHNETRNIIVLARNYDFGQTEANGFWTFARLVLNFGRFALQTNDFKQILSVSKVLLSGIELCNQFAKSDDNSLFGTSPDKFVHLLDVFKSLSPELDVIYGSFCAYWLCQSMRRSMTGFTSLMVFYYCKDNNNWTTLWNSEERAKTVAFIAQNANVEFVKSFWGLSENRFILKTIPKLKFKPNIIKDILIPRQNKFVIREQRVLREPTDHYVTRAQIRCRLLSHSMRASRSVVLHAHGGGFVSQSPESHEPYLRDWTQRLTEAAILSVDYSLSPQHKYPTALQELLDVYLWLRSPLASKELGFTVKDIVVCGDSAGGNLVMALVLILHKIGSEFVPKAILCFYSPLMLQTRASPSRLMTAIDTLLPLGVLLSCLEAYAPNDQNFQIIEITDISDDNNDDNIDDQMTTSKPSLWTLVRRLLRPRIQSKPWYRRPDLETKLLSLNTETSNEWISPLLTSDMPKNIPLYLIALHFDACLDDSIEMAKKWPGPVQLDVLDQLPHGFLNFIILSEEAKRASDLCADRIKQSLI